LKPKGEEVKAKIENQLMCALRARKAHLFIQKLHFFFLKLPAFRKKTNASTTKPPKHETKHLLSFRIRPPVGKGRHLTIKSKGQRNEGLNPFRTKGGNDFSAADSLHTHEKKRSRSRFHVLRSINPIYFAIFAR